jgi:acetyl-CoA C-acetyltransferase
MTKKVVIVAAKRSAIGSFGGSLAQTPATELGGMIISALLAESGVNPTDVSEVIMGQVLTAGVGQNPARQAAIYAKLPIDMPAFTVNQVCGSGLKAIHLAVQAIQSGAAQIVIAGGQENMSLSPHLVAGVRTGIKLGNINMLDSLVYDGLTDVYNQYHMGVTAENIATKYGITRLMQDELALESQMRAKRAIESGIFADEIVPITLPQKKGEAIIFARDEFAKAATNLESLARLRPAFKADGTVTAGNASGINDGAAAVMLMTEDKANELGLNILAVVKAYASVGVEPEFMGIGPVAATAKTLAMVNWSVDSLDVIEANEAFASQAIAVINQLGFDRQKVNVNGGAIALGHPIGASGCRIVVTLLHQMRRQDAKRGLATLCVGGGMGVALALERV